MSLINLTKIRSEIKGNVKNSSLSNDLIDYWANNSCNIIARAMDMDCLKETYSFNTVADQRTYFIEADINKIVSVVDTDNEHSLKELFEQDIDRLDGGHEDSGTPYYYSKQGMSEVIAQPTAASVVTVVSSDGADTTQTVRINGKDANGVDVTDQITITGIVAAAGTVSFTTVTGIRKSATSVGTFTLTSDVGAVTLVRIPANKYFNQYQQINLYPVPGDAIAFFVRYIRNPRLMTNAEDVPDLPLNFQDLVIMGTMVKAHEYFYEYDRAEKLEQRFEDQIKKLAIEQGKTLNNTRVLRAKYRKYSVAQSYGKIPRIVG